MRSFNHSFFHKTFAFWVLALPFVVFENRYEGPKVFIFLIGSIFITLYWLVINRQNITKVLNKWDFWYWIWIVALIITSIWGLDPLKSIIGGGYRHQGVIFFISLWLVGKTFLLLDNKTKLVFKKYFVISVVLQCILVICQKLFNYDVVNGRPIGTLGEANAVSGLINLTLFFSQNAYVVILVFITNLILQSRTGVLMFLIIVLPLIFKRKATLFIVTTVTLVLTLSLTLLRPKSIHFRFEDRNLYNKLAISAISKSPLIGYGLESTDVVFHDEFKNIDINLEDLMVDRSHNILLDILIWSGVLGLIPFAIWLFGNLFEIYKLKEFNRLFAIIAILFLGLLQPVWLIHWILLFLVINW